VCAPWPVVGLATEGVLCETFERGEALSLAIRRGCEDNAATCALGVDTYLKMLLRDNFMHSDLHPGNILYRSLLAEADGLESESFSRRVPETPPARRAPPPCGWCSSTSASPTSCPPTCATGS